MKAFLLALLLLLSSVTGGPVDPKPSTAFMEAHGCADAALEIVDDPGLNGMFLAKGFIPAFPIGFWNPTNTIFLTTGGFEQGHAMTIFLHELAHCQQKELGLRYRSVLEREWDADVRGADMACALGLDGIGMTRVAFTALHAEAGYVEDANHGAIFDRIDNVAAHACRAPHQAP